MSVLAVSLHREEKLFVNVVGKLSIVISTLLASWLLPRLGAYKSWVLGASLGVPAQLLLVLPWCGDQCQVGPYVATFIGALGGALGGPASLMCDKIDMKFRNLDLSRDQSR